jgi:hypothetical protein
MTNHPKLIQTILVLIIIILSVSCSSPNPIPTFSKHVQDAIPTPTPVIEYEVTSSRIILTSYEELIRYSEMVVIASIETHDGYIMHTYRQVEDRSQPSEGIFGLAKVYRAKVGRLH